MKILQRGGALGKERYWRRLLATCSLLLEILLRSHRRFLSKQKYYEWRSRAKIWQDPAIKQLHISKDEPWRARHGGKITPRLLKAQIVSVGRRSMGDKGKGKYWGAGANRRFYFTTTPGGGGQYICFWYNVERLHQLLAGTGEYKTITRQELLPPVSLNLLLCQEWRLGL